MQAPVSEPLVICGMGSLGQLCLERLRPFDVDLICVDCKHPAWRSEELKAQYEDQLILGDMRLSSTLKRAQVGRARSVLLLSSDSTINLEAALHVRILNTKAIIVVRSSSQQESLNDLLEARIPNLRVVDPLLLSASAIAQSLRPEQVPATFTLFNQRITLQQHDRSVDTSSKYLSRVLKLGINTNEDLHDQPVLTLNHQTNVYGRGKATRSMRQVIRRLSVVVLDFGRYLNHRVKNIQSWDLLIITALILFISGIPYFSNGHSIQSGFLITLALLKGEFVDPVNVLIEHSGQGITSLSPFALILAVTYAILGTILTAAIVALILDQLLSRRLGLSPRRRLSTGSRSVILLDGGSLADLVSSQLTAVGIEVLRLSSQDDIPNLSTSQLQRWTRHTQFVGAGLLSTDLLKNLRLALEWQMVFTSTRVAIITKDLDAGESLEDLLGGISFISTLDLAADAFVATAFGEQVEEVRRINGRTVLLVRYRIDEHDTLVGSTISRIQEGFGVTALALRRSHDRHAKIFPSLESRLIQDSELFVLADLQGLRRIELNQCDPPRWRLKYQVQCRSAQSFDTQQVLARHLGMAPGQFAASMDGLWHYTPTIDRDLAKQLQHELQRMAVRTELIETKG